MKKNIVFLIALCALLCSCSKSEAAISVDNMILEIGEVTLESRDKITDAEEAVEDLKKTEYNQLEHISILEEARKTYEHLLEEKQREENEKKISQIETAIDTIGVVTLDKQSAIKDIRTQYTWANEEVKAGIENYEILEQAEEQISILKVQNVINLIDQIGKVTLDSEEK